MFGGLAIEVMDNKELSIVHTSEYMRKKWKQIDLLMKNIGQNLSI